MKETSVIATVVLMVFVICGCSKMPKCDSGEAKDLVKWRLCDSECGIVGEENKDQCIEELSSNIKVKLSEIAYVSKDKDSRSCACRARMTIDKDSEKSTVVEYSLQKTEDGKLLIAMDSDRPEVPNSKKFPIFINVGYYGEEIKKISQEINQNPKDGGAYTIRGNMFLNTDNSYLWLRALDDFNKAIEIDTKSVSAYCGRGSVWMMQKKYHIGDDQQCDKAIQDFSRAIDLDPKCFTAYKGRGEALAEKGDYQNAILDYNKAIELNPTDPSTYSDRALSWQGPDYSKNRCADFRKACELGDCSSLEGASNICGSYSTPIPEYQAPPAPAPIAPGQ